MTEHETKLPRIVVAMDFSDDLMQQLKDAAPGFRVERHFPEVPDSVWANTEILYTSRLFPQPEQAPLLRWIQLHFAGMERVLKQPIVQAEDIEVTSASGIHATPIAEHVLGMMLAFNLQLPTLLAHQSQTLWHDQPHKLFNPKPLRGQTVGIAGYGSIGREVARLAHSFGMTVLASKRNAKRTEDTDYQQPGIGDPTGDIPERIYPAEALASMAAECDFLVVALPHTPATENAINEKVLNAMKKTAVIVNIARGSVIDEAALIEALTNDKIAGAALDVFTQEPLPVDSPLWRLQNVIISPHISGNHATYHERAMALFIENLKRYQEKRRLFNRLERERGY